MAVLAFLTSLESGVSEKRRPDHNNVEMVQALLTTLKMAFLFTDSAEWQPSTFTPFPYFKRVLAAG